MGPGVRWFIPTNLYTYLLVSTVKETVIKEESIEHRLAKIVSY